MWTARGVAVGCVALGLALAMSCVTALPTSPRLMDDVVPTAYRADLHDVVAGLAERVVTPKPLVNGTLPERFSWGSITIGADTEGNPLTMSFLTPSRNQHINTCKCCRKHTVLGWMSA